MQSYLRFSSNSIVLFVGSAILAGCANGASSGLPAPTSVGPLVAAPQSAGGARSAPTLQRDRGSSYTFSELDTLGGSIASGNSINDRAWITGSASLLGDATSHATLWKKGGHAKDLGTLGGPNSFISFPVKDINGVIAGGSDTTTTDPLSENFCGDSVPYTCLGFVWQNGVMSALSTLGGNNAAATGANNRGQVVGYAENGTQDPACIAPQVLDFFGVIWGPQKGKIRQLQPRPGDTISVALGINDHGQAIGGSGFCGSVGDAIAVHATLWRSGSDRATDLGSLGGSTNNFAAAINSKGEIVGVSDLPGDANSHAFFWKSDKMKDLGTLPGDASSIAFDINDKDQIVGQSCDPSGNCRAVLWQNGHIMDLNTFVSPSSPLFLTDAGSINECGDITGQAYNSSTGGMPAFLGVPGGHGAMKVSNPRPNIVLPESIRMQLKMRLDFPHGFIRKILP